MSDGSQVSKVTLYIQESKVAAVPEGYKPVPEGYKLVPEGYELVPEGYKHTKSGIELPGQQKRRQLSDAKMYFDLNIGTNNCRRFVN